MKIVLRKISPTLSMALIIAAMLVSSPPTAAAAEDLSPRPPPPDSPSYNDWLIGWDYISYIYPARNAGRTQPLNERFDCLDASWRATLIIMANPAAAAVLENDRSIAWMLILAQAGGESGCNPRAVSPDGYDLGWAQINSYPFKSHGRTTTMIEVLQVQDPFDVYQNAAGQARFMRDLLCMFLDVRLAVAGYNCGPSKIRNGYIPDNGRTQRYVADVMRMFEELKRKVDGLK